MTSLQSCSNVILSSTENAIVSDLHAAIAKAKRDGTVSVGFDTLFAMCTGTPAFRKYGPSGINARWVAAEIIRTRLIPASTIIRNFLMPS